MDNSFSARKSLEQRGARPTVGVRDLCLCPPTSSNSSLNLVENEDRQDAQRDISVLGRKGDRHFELEVESGRGRWAWNW